MFKLSDPSSQNRPIKEALHFLVFVGKTISSVDWPLSGQDSWGTSSHRNSWPLSSTKGMFMLSFPYRKYCHPDPRNNTHTLIFVPNPLEKDFWKQTAPKTPESTKTPDPSTS